CLIEVKLERFSEDKEAMKRKHESASDGPMYISPVNRFDTKFPFFRQPKEIGFFSQDSDRQFRADDSSLRYYCAPKPECDSNFDLKAGFDTFIKKDDSVKERLDDLLRWVILNREKFRPPDADKNPVTSLCTDFICWRGLLTRVLCTPYEQREGWIIAVIKLRGTFYLCEYDTEEKKHQITKETHRQLLLQYGGFKFEQYMTSKSPSEKPETSVPVNNNEGFCSVVRSRLDQHSMVFGGEVDCYSGDKKEKEYVELKTSREMDKPNQLRNFKKFKLLKWWCQSFLLGVPRVVCGFRDDDSIVQRIKTYSTLEIPKLCQDVHDCWQPNVCFNFCNQFFKHVKEVVCESNSASVTVFTYLPQRKCIVHEDFGEESEFHFLPEWYTNSWEQKKIQK
ncbi:hypothetical protein CAPTEDRAFT_186717, partial [Capitella teleta]